MQINQYPNEAFVINDEDFYDVDFWTGSAFQTRKISGASLKSVLSGLALNIYNSDGTLSGPRIVDLAGETLTFESSGDAVIQITASNSAAINLVRASGAKAWAILKDVDGSEDFRIDRHDATGTFLDTPVKIYTTDGVIEFNGAYRFPTADGSPDFVLATDGSGNLQWIGLADVNIYNTDGGLAEDRYVSLDGFTLYFSDIAGITQFTGGNLIRVTANSGQRSTIELNAGNSQTRQISFTDNAAPRWSIETDDTEIGGDTGTNLYFKSYDDSGLPIGVPFKIDRSTGEIYINNQYRLPLNVGTNGYVLTTDGIGNTSWEPVGGTSGFPNVITASSQWSKTLAAPVTLNNNDVANGFTFFDNVVDKVANGTTPYYEFDIDFGITITLSGTSGSANINVNGVNYLATYTVSLFQTAVNWVAANQAALNALGLVVFALGSGADGRIRFGGANAAILNAISITNVTPDLSGILANEFTGLPNAAGDHVRVQYTGEPIDGQRLLHTIRANFNITIGSVQYAELRLYRYQNDSIIGSGVSIQRNPDESGQQVVIETYTGGSSDAFVVGGFYIGVANNTGTSLEFTGASGILIQTIFQQPTLF